MFVVVCFCGGYCVCLFLRAVSINCIINMLVVLVLGFCFTCVCVSPLLFVLRVLLLFVVVLLLLFLLLLMCCALLD